MVTGDELRRARSRAKLTQGELAKRLGVSLRTVGNWESGQPIAPFNLAAIEDFVAESGMPAGLDVPHYSIAWPEGTFDGLDSIEVDEVLTAARLAGLDRARVIRLAHCPLAREALER